MSNSSEDHRNVLFIAGRDHFRVRIERPVESRGDTVPPASSMPSRKGRRRRCQHRALNRQLRAWHKLHGIDARHLPGADATSALRARKRWRLTSCVCRRSRRRADLEFRRRSVRVCNNLEVFAVKFVRSRVCTSMPPEICLYSSPGARADRPRATHADSFSALVPRGRSARNAEPL